MVESRLSWVGKGSLAAAAIGIAVAALYGTAGGGGNGSEAAVCAATAARARALDPLVHGEVAAFQVARQSQNLAALAFTGANGEPLTLRSFEGKLTLVNLWATWCAPCRQEMPALDRLQAALGGPEFEVVPISIDTTGPERPAEFLEGVGVQNLPLYTDRSTQIFREVEKRSLALGLPVSILVDGNGCHLGHMNAPAEWDSPDAKALIEAVIGAAPAV